MAKDDKSMTAKEVRDLPDSELLTQLVAAKDDLLKHRFSLATGQLENPALLHRTKRHIARLSTELRAREIAAHEELQTQGAAE